MTLEIHNWSSTTHREIHKVLKDEIFPIVNQVDARIQNFEIQFLKEAAKFVRDFKSLSNKADEYLDKHKALELEIERLLRAVVNQDIIQNRRDLPRNTPLDRVEVLGFPDGRASSTWTSQDFKTSCSSKFNLHDESSNIKSSQSLCTSTPHKQVAVDQGNTSGSAEDSMQLKELMVLVPTLVTRINSLEKELKETKQTLGNVVLKLVKKVKSLEKALKRKSKKVLISESEGEEPEDQGRKIQDIDDDPLVSLVRESMKEKSTDFVTPTKASGEAQEEEISPTILEAAKTLSKVASQGVSKEKSTDKGKRYRRRARSMAKKIDTGLDAEEEINTGREEINTGIEEVSTGSTKVDSGTASKRGQREGKAPMVEEDIQATHKTKEQMRQEEAGLEEAIKLQAQMDEEVAKQIHLDKMTAKRMAEEEALYVLLSLYRTLC
ncbi:hypothetical protein Tco_0999625 [Tanacetum coccineum]